MKEALKLFCIQVPLWLLVSGFLTPAFPQQSRFDLANEWMEELRFEEAFTAYREIEKEGYRSGKLYFNMAVAAVQLDSLGLAKFYMLQSARFDETREEAEEALRAINEQFDRRSAVLPKLPWERFYDWLTDEVGVVMLLLAGVLLLQIGTGGIIASWFYQRTSKFLSRAGLVTAGFALLLIFISLCIRVKESRYAAAVVVVRSETVHEEPDSTSAAVSSAYEGYQLRVDRRISEEEEGWTHVRLENGLEGWIGTSAIRIF